ncbi:MAG: DNA polymerase III subunit delta [Bacteroidetes bacterium]|nr:MAG: DNA polymerase III subunit delta [Bacteroidota bacterium]
MQFSDVIGQTKISSRLRDSVRSGRIAHAQLFDGPEGSGTIALARAYARYLHCENPSLEDSCGVCNSCLAHEKLQHPDLQWAFPFFKKDGSTRSVSDPFQIMWREFMLESSYIGIEDWLNKIGADRKQLFISVDEALEINRKLGLKSFHGGYKILIFWLPETMRVDTANKMLKLIEEPTDKTVIIFVSEKANRLLPTILSRLQTVHIPKLKEIEATNGISIITGVSTDKAAEWAHITDANIAAAIRLSRVGSETPDLQLFSNWMRSCWARDGEGIMNGANEFASLGREGQKKFLSYGLHMIRQCILGNYGVNSLVRLTEGEQSFLSKFQRFIHEKNVVALSAFVEDAHKDIASNVNAKVVFFDLSIKLHTLLRIES